MSRENGLFRSVPVAVLAALPLHAAPTVPKQDRYVYCTQDAEKHWQLQSFQPLLNLHHEHRFVQFDYDGSWLRTVRVNTVKQAYELIFEYKFDKAGALVAFHGYVRRWGAWQAEADLFPTSDGVPAHPYATFTTGGSDARVTEPEDARLYTRALDNATLYRSVAEVPCAGLLKEAGN